MAMQGIDVSSYQAGLDLSNVSCDFVIIGAGFAAVMVDSGVFTGPEPAEIIVDASGNMSYAGGLDYTGTVSGDALLIGIDGMTYICTDDP